VRARIAAVSSLARSVDFAALFASPRFLALSPWIERKNNDDLFVFCGGCAFLRARTRSSGQCPFYTLHHMMIVSTKLLCRNCERLVRCKTGRERRFRREDGSGERRSSPHLGAETGFRRGRAGRPTTRLDRSPEERGTGSEASRDTRVCRGRLRLAWEDDRSAAVIVAAKAASPFRRATLSTLAAMAVSDSMCVRPGSECTCRVIVVRRTTRLHFAARMPWSVLRAIENQVRFRLDVLVLPFCEVLMMQISFALPFPNDKCT